MNISDPNNEDFFALAIQSVLHNQKHRIHLFLNSDRSLSFIREMSEEIVRRAQRFKEMSQSTPCIEDVPHKENFNAIIK